MKRAAFNHPKFKRLARRLGMPVWAVEGLVARIWNIASIRFPAGDIGRFSAEDLALDIGYDEDHDELVRHLVECKLLDRLPDAQGTLYIHDWHEHAEDTTHRHLARKRLYFANGDIPRLTALGTNERGAAEEWYSAQVTHECKVIGESSPKFPQVPPSPPENPQVPPSSPSRAHTEPLPFTSAVNHLPVTSAVNPLNPLPPSEPGETNGVKPDGTRRLTDEEAEAIDWAAESISLPLENVNPSQVRAIKRLFVSGCSVALWRQVVNEETRSGINSLNYFVKICETRLKEIQPPAGQAPAQNGLRAKHGAPPSGEMVWSEAALQFERDWLDHERRAKEFAAERRAAKELAAAEAAKGATK